MTKEQKADWFSTVIESICESQYLVEDIDYLEKKQFRHLYKGSVKRICAAARRELDESLNQMITQENEKQIFEIINAYDIVRREAKEKTKQEILKVILKELEAI